MLHTILFCIFVSFASARAPNQQIHHLGPEVLLNVQKFTLPCIEKTNADPGIFKQLVDGNMENNEVNKNFLYCFAVSGKFTDEDGHLNIKRMSSMLGNHPLIEPFEAALAECNKITKENPVETTYAMSVCINEDAPVRFGL